MELDLSLLKRDSKIGSVHDGLENESDDDYYHRDSNPRNSLLTKKSIQKEKGK